MRRRITIVVLAGLVGALVGAIAQFPAARAVALFEPAGVEFAGVQGTVWNGRAQRVAAQELPPASAVRWETSTWQLLLGRLAGEVRFDVAGGRGEGAFRLTPNGAARVRDVQYRGPAAGIARDLPVPLLLVEGDVTLVIQEGRVRAGGPHAIDARLRWDGAVVRQPLDVELGAISVALSPTGAGAHRLVVDARDGALAATGGGDIDADGRYEVELRIEPAADAPAEIIDLLDAIAARDGDAYVIRQSGQLPL